MFNLFVIWLTATFLDIVFIKDFDFFLANFSERFLINIGLSSFALLLIILLLRNFKKTLYFFLVIPTIIQATYFEIYKKLVSSFGFQTFFEDSNMVLNLWLENINFWKTIFLILAFLFLVKNLKNIKIHKVISFGSSFLLISIYTLIMLSWYSVPNFQNSIISYYGSLFDSIRLGIYQHSQINRPKLEIQKKENLPNIIFVVGESLVLNHTSLFGYSRNTTPNLLQLEKNQEIVKFKNVVSIGTKTRLSVPYMLVGISGIDPKGEIYKYPTIINYAKSIGYKTIFITAQDLSWGGMKDFLIDKDVDYFVNGTKYNPNARVHKGADDLEITEKEIFPIIENEKQPFFIVYQMDGNHYPYSKHSPQNWKKWQENGKNSVNAYDNSVLYSDEVLSSIISRMRNKFQDSWLFYSTDHGQNLGGKGGMFNDNFSQDVIHNTFFISPPNKYLKKLQKLQNSPLSQVDIVSTILDIWKIQPIFQLDGYSLLQEIPNNRMRITSTFMPTLHNTPEAVLLFPDMQYWYFDFLKKSVTLKDGKTAIPLSDIEQKYLNLFRFPSK